MRDARRPAPPGRHEVSSRNTVWYLLLVIPFVALLWPASYSRVEPMIAGVPFFYWYQFVWVVIAAVLTQVVFNATRGGRLR